MSFWSLFMFSKTVRIKHTGNAEVCIQNLKRYINAFDERYFVIRTSNPCRFVLSKRVKSRKSMMIENDYDIATVEVKETEIIADFSKGTDTAFLYLGLGLVFELLLFIAFFFFDSPNTIYPIIAIPVFYLILVLIFNGEVKNGTDWIKWNIIKTESNETNNQRS